MDIHSESDEEDADVSCLPSLETCGMIHEVIDYGQTKKEICGVAKEMLPRLSNIEDCLMANKVTKISNSEIFVNSKEDDIKLDFLKNELNIYKRKFLYF